MVAVLSNIDQGLHEANSWDVGDLIEVDDFFTDKLLNGSMRSVCLIIQRDALGIERMLSILSTSGNVCVYNAEYLAHAFLQGKVRLLRRYDDDIED